MAGEETAVMNKIRNSSNIGFTPQYLTVDGKPWFPVMGEIHYSRVARQDWERELCRMKAGGVDVVSAYTIWIHHEEEEGVFDFSGQRDLRAFLALVQKCGLKCFLRIGPWIHGEVRNGGFPDWLVKKERDGEISRLRTDDPVYLRYVRRFYEKVFEQARGFFFAEGDGTGVVPPVIGIQVENEYGHCGGLTGEAGEKHMRTLRAMAEEIGFAAPLWTATGWGGAVTGGMLPVMGGYCEAPWDPRTTPIEPSANYVFTEERNDHGIGSDYGLGEGITFDMTKFPYLTAELGGGLQVTRHRRPVASADDIAAMSAVKLGSGCNLLGYYMYHGGTNPEGRLTTLQESRETGYPNDLPVKSYDFNAPVREYGQLTDTWRRLRMLAMFVHDYEDILCRTAYVPQPGNAADADDLTSLRTAVRYDPESEAGFFFVNNYVRRCTMASHPGVPLRAYVPASSQLSGEAVCLHDDTAGGQNGAAGAPGDRIAADFGVHDIQNGDYFFWPFRLPLGDAVLASACAVPLCILHGADGGKDVFVFFTPDGKAPEYRMEQGSARFLTLSEEEALHAAKVTVGGREHLMISGADAMTDADGRLTLLKPVRAEEEVSFRIFPDLAGVPEGFSRVAGSSGGDFTEYILNKTLTNRATADLVRDGKKGGRWKLRAERLPHGADAEGTFHGMDSEGLSHDTNGSATARAIRTMLLISYEGNTAKLLKGQQLAADNFYTGQVWEVAADRIQTKEELAAGTLDADLEIEPLTEEEPVFLEHVPEMRGGKACRILSVRTETLYEIRVNI